MDTPKNINAKTGKMSSLFFNVLNSMKKKRKNGLCFWIVQSKKI